MSKRLSPEDFAPLDLLHEARRLARNAEARAPVYGLDPKTAVFLVRDYTWELLIRETTFVPLMASSVGPKARTLLGYPVRITTGDAPDIPLIELVMEFKVGALK